MTQAFKDHFSQISAAYRSFRPQYPEELFQWLAQVSPRQEAALDCGCGTGQAAVALARYFATVCAVDPIAEQIANAAHNERVNYLVAPAEATGLPGGSQDLIIAAQALHWFDLDRFYREVGRVAREGAIFAAFSYGLMTVNEDIDSVIGHLYRDMLGPYWPPERRHVDAGYLTLPFPFREIDAPQFAMTAHWQLDHLMGYLATWSAVKEFKTSTGEDPLTRVTAELQAAWGETGEGRRVSWPLVIRAGRIN